MNLKWLRNIVRKSSSPPPAPTPLLSDLCAESNSAPCHLHFVVFIKSFTLCHSKVVLPVSRHPWNKVKSQGSLQVQKEEWYYIPRPYTKMSRYPSHLSNSTAISKAPQVAWDIMGKHNLVIGPRDLFGTSGCQSHLPFLMKGEIEWSMMLAGRVV